MFQVANDICYGFKLGQGLVRDNNSVLVLNAHQQLQDIQGIGPEVLLDEALRGNFGGVQPELFGQDGLYFLKHRD